MDLESTSSLGCFRWSSVLRRNNNDSAYYVSGHGSRPSWRDLHSVFGGTLMRRSGRGEFC